MNSYYELFRTFCSSLLHSSFCQSLTNMPFHPVGQMILYKNPD